MEVIGIPSRGASVGLLLMLNVPVEPPMTWEGNGDGYGYLFIVLRPVWLARIAASSCVKISFW